MQCNLVSGFVKKVIYSIMRFRTSSMTRTSYASGRLNMSWSTSNSEVSAKEKTFWWHRNINRWRLFLNLQSHHDRFSIASIRFSILDCLYQFVDYHHLLYFHIATSVNPSIIRIINIKRWCKCSPALHQFLKTPLPRRNTQWTCHVLLISRISREELILISRRFDWKFLFNW